MVDLIPHGIEIVVLGFTISLNIAQALAGIIVSVALGFLEQLFTKKKKSDVLPFTERRQLNEMSPQPAYLSAYGPVRLGRHITERRVKGRFLYLQLLVQSRPSAGPWALYLDNRYVPLSGDPTDFAGPGAVSHNPDPVTWPEAALLSGYVRAWFGYGDQVSVPDVLVADVPDLAEAPIWPGFSVAWLKINLGPDASARQRWPNQQPIVAVEGPMSLVWDPRDPAQDRDDPSTWGYSDNQALAVLDMIRNENCVNAPDAVNVASFVVAADIADEQVPIKAGGTEPRYRVAGFWEADGTPPFEMIEPANLAGMTDVAEVDGEWVITPGKYLPPEVTWSEDILHGPAVELIDERDPADMMNTAQVQFSVPERNWELQPLPDLIDPAALAADNGERSNLPIRLEWVSHIAQAYRIGWRAIQLTRYEREVSGTFASRAIQAHYGARVAIDLATIWGEVVEFTVGSWEMAIEETDSEAGIARLVVVMRLRETDPAIDVVDTDAQPELGDLITAAVSPPIEPPVIDAVAAEAVVTPGGTVINARITCDQSSTASASAYQIRYRRDYGGGSYGPYTAAPDVQADELGEADQFTVLIGPLETASYEVEVRTISVRGYSPWALEAFTISAPTTPPPAPTLVAGASGTDHVVTWRTPDDPRHERLVLWEGASASFGAATVSESIGTFPDTEVVNVGSGASGVPVYYWATSRDVWGNDSAPAGPAVHTTP